MAEPVFVSSSVAAQSSTPPLPGQQLHVEEGTVLPPSPTSPPLSNSHNNPLFLPNFLKEFFVHFLYHDVIEAFVVDTIVDANVVVVVVDNDHVAAAQSKAALTRKDLLRNRTEKSFFRTLRHRVILSRQKYISNFKCERGRTLIFWSHTFCSIFLCSKMTSDGWNIFDEAVEYEGD